MFKYQISLKSVQWELRCYMRTDRQTDRQKIVVTFRILQSRLKDQRPAHTLHLRVLCGSQKKNTATIFTYSINLLVLIFQSVFPSRYELIL